MSSLYAIIPLVGLVVWIYLCTDKKDVDEPGS